MFYSTMSSLEIRPGMSSDEEEDIYCQVLNPPPHPTEKTSDPQVEPNTNDRDTLKPDQVRHEEKKLKPDSSRRPASRPAV